MSYEPRAQLHSPDKPTNSYKSDFKISWALCWQSLPLWGRFRGARLSLLYAILLLSS